MQKLLIFSALALVFGFAACKKEKNGTTKSGNKYTIWDTGSGDEKAAEGSFVKIQVYEYMNDTLQNSTRKFGRAQITKIPTKTQMPGEWPAPIEALLMLGIGDSVRIFENLDSIQLPPQMAHVKSIYTDIVLEDIMTQEEVDKERADQQAKIAAKRDELVKNLPAIETKIKGLAAGFTAKSLGDQLKSDPTGLQYVILEQGDGSKVARGEKTSVHYYGVTTDGKMFDNSFERGEALEFEVGAGQLIKGWDEGIQLFNRGSKVALFIPAELGYGAAGSPPAIPANATIIFYMEILK